MSLDIALIEMQPVEVVEVNFTHNLTPMAEEAGLYDCLWRAEENGFKKAKQIIPILKVGIQSMEANPQKFKNHTPPNGWGSYDGFLNGCKKLLKACIEYPESDIYTDR